MNQSTGQSTGPIRGRRVALVGPGRAGTAFVSALVAAGSRGQSRGHGSRVVAIAGRSPDAPSTVAAAVRWGVAPVEVAAVGHGADLVVVATPDGSIDAVAAAVAGGLEPGALVVHLCGARGLEALAPVVVERADVSVGALHPLQTLTAPSSTTGDGAGCLAGSWVAVAGGPEVFALAEELGMHPFVVVDAERARYHAAAVVASNHLVALLGQVERLAAGVDVPLAAFEPLVRTAVDNAFTLGPAVALTGPVARGDVDTVLRHLDDLDPDERRAYRALAEEARRLAGRDDPTLEAALAVEVGA